MALDPVCKMTVREDIEEEKLEYEGKTYHFCAAGCRERFIKDPGKYAGEEKTDRVRGE